MQHKMSLVEFCQEAKNETDQFDAVEQSFAEDASLTKLNRRIGGSSYSHIWYLDPSTQKKVAIRLSNKNVAGYVLGSGSYGRAKYGVDKYGRVYAVKIQHNYIDSYDLQNLRGFTPERAGQYMSNGTFTVINKQLYFQSGTNRPPEMVPPPQGNIPLETVYSHVKSAITKQNFGEIRKTDTALTTDLIKLLVASNMELMNDPLNVSATPVSEAKIAHDVQLARGEQTQRNTQSFLLKVGSIRDNELAYGTLYLREDQGFLGYKMKLSDGTIIRRRTNIKYPINSQGIQALKSEIIAFARDQGDIPAKDTPANLTGNKQYQVLELGESTLEEALKKNTLDLGEKLSTTRRLLWASSKLHTGKLSRSQQAYIHCDLKPGNILLNPRKKNVLLIDYGLSVSANTSGTLHCTPWYAPVVADTDPINSRARNFDHHYARRVQGLGTGFDVFSLKRIIRMPQHSNYGAGRCIFNRDEWANLPTELKKGIEISEDKTSTDRAVEAIRQSNETALDLAMRFIAMEAVDRTANKIVQDQNYSENIQKLTLANMTLARQEMVCECAELIDLIQIHDPGQTQHNYQEIIAAVSNEDGNALLSLKASLLKQACLLLLAPEMGIEVSAHEAWRKQLEILDPHIEDQLILLTTVFEQIREADNAPNKIIALNELLPSFQEAGARMQPSPISSLSAVASSDSEDISMSSQVSSLKTTGKPPLHPATESSGLSQDKPSTAQSLKDRLSSMKSPWIPCLWTNQVCADEPNTIYVKTTQGNPDTGIEIQCMIRDDSQPDKVQIVAINPENLGLDELTCPLSESDFLNKISPKIQTIAAHLQTDKIQYKPS